MASAEAADIQGSFSMKCAGENNLQAVRTKTNTRLLCNCTSTLLSSLNGVLVCVCVGCHMNGGNVLAAGATLFPEDLKRNGSADPESMFNLIYRGKGRMPGYGEGCTPKVCLLRIAQPLSLGQSLVNPNTVLQSFI
jgi:hypothetical protein